MKSFGDLMKQAQKMQKQMAEVQEKLEEARFEASAGGGLVHVVVDGRQILKELKLDPKLLEETDITVVEDLVVTAIGEAQKNSNENMKSSLGKLTGGIPLPF